MGHSYSRRYQGVVRACETRNYQAALKLGFELTQYFPNSVNGWVLASRVALKASDPEQALKFADRALKLEPEKASSIIQQVHCLLTLNRKLEATNRIRKADSLCENDPLTLDAVGNLYSLIGEQRPAMKCFEKASNLNPESAHHLYNLAIARQALGELSAAELAYDKVISLCPNDWEAYLQRSRLRIQSVHSNNIKELNAAIHSEKLPWRGKVSLYYALAKEYEDIHAYKRSFDALTRGAALRRSHMQYNALNDVNIIEQVIEHYTLELIQSSEMGCSTSEPIFIVGLPRTGTTLVDRTLGSHKSVFSAGELNNFAHQMVKNVRNENGHEEIGLVKLSTKTNFEKLGVDYLSSTRPQTGHTQHFIDKLPLNFLYCGLIHLAMPHAKIIHIKRHPMDSCYAIYKTLFKQAYPYSYQLEDLGQYYLAYTKLMEHWHSVLPGVILDVQYEDLVSNHEAVSKNICSYCDLDWDPNCLDFHNSRAPTMTASQAQVRQPVYSSSVGLWKNYEEQLAPLRKQLSSCISDDQ